jgi:Sporulation and spore germination
VRGCAAVGVLRAVVLTVLVVVLAACGVPTGGAPSRIAPSDVPFGLGAPTPSGSPAPTAEPEPAPFRVFLVDAGDVLVAQPRELDGGTPRDRLAELLRSLEEAPTASERAEQLSTALPPEVELAVGDLTGGTATIDLGLPAGAPSGSAGRRAVAQIVLTATTVPGVDSVRLTVGGDPVEAPLPSGELTSAPLTAEDYATFRTPAPTAGTTTPP